MKPRKCKFCNQPVDLEHGLKLPDGTAAHEECHAAKTKPYTLTEVMDQLRVMRGSQDLVWCRWIATDILERGIDAMPTIQAMSREPRDNTADLEDYQ